MLSHELFNLFLSLLSFVSKYPEKNIEDAFHDDTNLNSNTWSFPNIARKKIARRESLDFAKVLNFVENDCSCIFLELP